MEQISNCLACGSSSFDSVERTKTMMHSSREFFNFDQCHDCGLVFLNPRVPNDQLGHYYTEAYLPYRGDEAWGKYAKFVASSQKKIDQKRVELIEKYISDLGRSTILDVGCGKPTFLKLLNERHGCRAIGTDFSDEGWKNKPELYTNLDLVAMDIHKLESLDEVDGITMWHYLEHDYNPAKTIQKLSTIAKPSTRLIIEVPNYDSSSRRQFKSNWAGYHTPRHTALYTPKTMKTLLNKNGWKVVDSFTYGTLDPFTLHWMSQKEAAGIDWSLSMESEFVAYVKGMIRFWPQSVFQKRKSLGFMTVIAELCQSMD